MGAESARAGERGFGSVEVSYELPESIRKQTPAISSYPFGKFSRLGRPLWTWKLSVLAEPMASVLGSQSALARLQVAGRSKFSAQSPILARRIPWPTTAPAHTHGKAGRLCAV